MRLDLRIRRLQEELKEARETIRDLSRALSNVTACRCNCTDTHLPKETRNKAQTKYCIDNENLRLQETEEDDSESRVSSDESGEPEGTNLLEKNTSEILKAEFFETTEDVRSIKENVEEIKHILQNWQNPDKKIKNPSEDLIVDETPTENIAVHIMKSVDEIKEIIKNKSNLKADEGNKISDCDGDEEIRSAVKEIACIMKEEREFKRKQDEERMAQLKELLGEDNQWVLERIYIFNGTVIIDDEKTMSYTQFNRFMRCGPCIVFPEEYEAEHPNGGTYFALAGYFQLEGSIETCFNLKCGLKNESKSVIPALPTGLTWVKYNDCGHLNIARYKEAIKCAVCDVGSSYSEVHRSEKAGINVGVYPRRKTRCAQQNERSNQSEPSAVFVPNGILNWNRPR